VYGEEENKGEKVVLEEWSSMVGGLGIPSYRSRIDVEGDGPVGSPGSSEGCWDGAVRENKTSVGVPTRVCCPKSVSTRV
jgi:hypothetical protein